MKKVTKREKAIPFVLCAMYILPVVISVLNIKVTFGGNIGKPVPVSAVYIIITALATYAAAFIAIRNRQRITTLPFAMYFVAFALSVVFTVCYSLTDHVGSVLILVLTLSVFLCCFVNCTVILGSRASKFIFAVLSALPLIIVSIFVILFSLMSMAFADLGMNTVVGHYDSPNGAYRIEVIDVDQGALGGDTVVRLYYEKPILNLGIVKIMKKPEGLYVGDWREHINISWVDNDTVVINGTKYDI